MTLEALNRLPEPEARAAFERCCGAARWVERMTRQRPYASRAALREASEAAFEKFHRDDWLAAFRHHPKIGDVAALRARFASTAAWAGAEQQGAAGADEATLAALAAGNRAYEERFGYIFIVCATGKSAGEMLALLESRLGNDAVEELAIAAGEQQKITALRIAKLLDQDDARTAHAAGNSGGRTP